MKEKHSIINWFEPDFSEEEEKRVADVVKSGFVNEGKLTKEFEDKVKDLLGVKHAVAATSGTVALFLGLASLGIGPGDEVIVPDITFIASANAVKLAGAKPVLADIKKEDLTIDPEDVKKKITKKTKAIIPVHIVGRCCDMKKLSEIAKKHNLEIIEDACESFGSKYGDKYTGTISKIGCTSFAPNKIITTGQGGMVLTNDDEIYEKLIRLKDHGRLKRSDEVHETFGYNFKFSDILAAVGLGQLEKLSDRIKMFKKQYKLYEDYLKDVKQVKIIKTNIEKGECPLWIDFFVEDRGKLVDFLKEKNIHTRPLWLPLHSNPPYKMKDSEFPNSTSIAKKVLWLPNGPKITEKEIKFICSVIKEFYS